MASSEADAKSEDTKGAAATKTTSGSMTYRSVAPHSIEVEVGDARVQVAPGGYVDLSSSDFSDSENNEALKDEGWLIEAPGMNPEQ